MDGCGPHSQLLPSSTTCQPRRGKTKRKNLFPPFPDRQASGGKGRECEEIILPFLSLSLSVARPWWEIGVDLFLAL